MNLWPPHIFYLFDNPLHVQDDKVDTLQAADALHGSRKGGGALCRTPPPTNLSFTSNDTYMPKEFAHWTAARVEGERVRVRGI